MNTEIAAALRDFFRIGEVVSTDPETVTARVRFPDADDMVSYNLKVAQRKTLRDKDYWMPDVNELVACIFLGNGAVAGFVIFAIYNETDTPPITSQDKRYVQFDDGTLFEYDRDEHKLKIEIKGDTTLDIEGENGGSLEVRVKDGIVVETESALNASAKTVTVTTESITVETEDATLEADTADINATSEVNISSPAVNLGNGAAFGVVHEASPCPMWGVCHINASQTTMTAP